MSGGLFRLRCKWTSSGRRLSKTFPRKVRRTADPSASLGMTKRRGLLQGKDRCQRTGRWLRRETTSNRPLLYQRSFLYQRPFPLPTVLSFTDRPFLYQPPFLTLATALSLLATALLLKQQPSPFCHPERSEGSAVLRTFLGNVFRVLSGIIDHRRRGPAVSRRAWPAWRAAACSPLHPATGSHSTLADRLDLHG